MKNMFGYHEMNFTLHNGCNKWLKACHGGIVVVNSKMEWKRNLEFIIRSAIDCKKSVEESVLVLTENKRFVELGNLPTGIYVRDWSSIDDLDELYADKRKILCDGKEPIAIYVDGMRHAMDRLCGDNFMSYYALKPIGGNVMFIQDPRTMNKSITVNAYLNVELHGNWFHMNFFRDIESMKMYHN